MVSGGQGVWLAVQGSPVVRLYHAVTHECLCEASVGAPVTKMLAGAYKFEANHFMCMQAIIGPFSCYFFKYGSI